MADVDVRANDFAATEAKLIGAAVKDMRKLATEIMADATRHCPYDPEHDYSKYFQHLRDSGYVRGRIRTVQFGFVAPYAGYVSEGTSKMRGDPFWKAALYKPRRVGS